MDAGTFGYRGMVVYTVVCEECGATRVAREKEGDVVPYRTDCEECGESEFSILAD